MINAVIYVLPENYGFSAARCLEYCNVRRYNVVGIVPGDWRAAMQMLTDGVASVVVVSSPEQLDPAREPRIEVVPKRVGRRPRRTANVPPSKRWAPAEPIRGATPIPRLGPR